jgi:tight adherence protein C
VGSSLTLTFGVLGLFVGLAVLLSTIGGLTRERMAVGRSLAAVEAMQSMPDSMRKEIDKPFSERVIQPFVGGLSNLGRRLTASGQVERIRKRLDYAGNPARWDVDRVIAFKALFLFVGVAVGLLLTVGLGAGFGLTLIVTVGLALVGFFGPDIVLYQVGYERTERMRRELPDALDLLSITVEAGLAFDAALAQVARNTTGPVAQEFFRVLQEMQIGLGRTEALRALGDRANLPELRGFVTAMVQADAFGVPIANVLKVQARELRIKRSQRAEEQAQKVPVKILFPLIFCILPTLFVIVIGPAAISIIRNFKG